MVLLDSSTRNIEKPKSKNGERFVDVIATLFTYHKIEEQITYDTYTEKFILTDFQGSAHFIGWRYMD